METDVLFNRRLIMLNKLRLCVNYAIKPNRSISMKPFES